MVKRNFAIIIIFASILTGCAQVIETTKVLWGSSTKALEDARGDAIEKTYQCSLDDCYDAVLSFKRNEKKVAVNDVIYQQNNTENTDDKEESIEGEEKKSDGMFDVFIDDRAKRHIVVMGVAGSVDTTEVGIFFSRPSQTTVKLEVSSLSSNAKRKVAEALFGEMDLLFSAAE